MIGDANIAGCMSEMARRLPNQLALVVPRGRHQPLTEGYIRFDLISNLCARGLRQVGITENMRTVVMIPPGDSLAVFVFALFKLGAIPVMIDPGMGLRGIGKCIADAAPAAFVGTAKAHWGRRLLGWGRPTVTIKVMTDNNDFGVHGVEDIVEKGASQSFVASTTRLADDHAAILFTSGSTGPAKGAVYTHGMFQEQIRVLRDEFRIQPGEVDLCTFPLFALFAPALGMTSIVPDMNPTRPALADPRKLVQAILDYEVTNLFGSPALINVLSRYGEQHSIKLPTLRRVISAGAPVSASVVERMSRMLQPGVQVYTPYGATEALPISVIGSDEILGETSRKTDQGAGICVGRTVGNIQARIVAIHDEPLPCDSAATIELPTGQRGEICVSGPVVSQSYWNRPDADALHKFRSAGVVWHRTGDIGYFDDLGRLWFCGRKAHRVVLPDQTLFTIPVEAVFNAHPDVYRTALVGVARGRRLIPALCIELERRCRRRTRDVIAELKSIQGRHPHTGAVQHFLIHRGFPVDIRHNAKINREQLGHWAARRLR